MPIAAPLSGPLRIGPFSRRLGVSVSVLRAWESRYGLFTPLRTPSGYRLYGPEDEARGRRMLAHLGRGLAARESAALALVASVAGADVPAPVAAWRGSAGERAHSAHDALLGGGHPATAGSARVLPALTDAASEWAGGELGTAQVHF